MTTTNARRSVRLAAGNVAVLALLTASGQVNLTAAESRVSIRLQQAAAPVAVRCDTVLTAEEVTAIVGAVYQGPQFREVSPGFTDCDWQGDDTNLNIDFSTLEKIKSDGETADHRFEMHVAAVESDTRKRQPLKGVGVNAILVDLSGLAEHSVLVAVQRPDGVARMTFYKVAKDKVLALARAVATP